jgi:cytochrome oxidase Cu insertion factor (SCO1/SenC/PrrC family)
MNQEGVDMNTKLHSPRSRALGMHLVLVLVTGLLASQLLVASQPLSTPAPAGQATSETAVVEADTPWGGDYFPNTLLTDQDGHQMRFFDDMIKGKVVVINFIFTSCSDSCPLETARLRQVQKLLGDRVGKDIFFYSISIDPLSDTPEVLKAYAQRFQVGPGWKFLTGEFADVTDLRKKLGLFIEGVDNGRQPGNGALDESLAVRKPVDPGRPTGQYLAELEAAQCRGKLRQCTANPSAKQWRRAVSHPLRVLPQPRPAGRAGHRPAQHRPGPDRRDPSA